LQTLGVILLRLDFGLVIFLELLALGLVDLLLAWTVLSVGDGAWDSVFRAQCFEVMETFYIVSDFGVVTKWERETGNHFASNMHFQSVDNIQSEV
jgi:hypothetical protein